MYQEWSFFRSLVSNAEMTLFKSDPAIARRYVDRLVEPALHPIFDEILGEYHRSVDGVLQLTGHAVLIGDNPMLRRTLAVRDAYLDPINMVQVSLLARAQGRRGARPRPGPRPAAHHQRHRHRTPQHRLIGESGGGPTRTHPLLPGETMTICSTIWSCLANKCWCNLTTNSSNASTNSLCEPR